MHQQKTLGGQRQEFQEEERSSADSRERGQVVELSEAEAAVINSMPPEMKESETEFVLNHSPGTRSMWLNLPPCIRTRAAESIFGDEFVQSGKLPNETKTNLCKNNTCQPWHRSGSLF